MDRTYNIDQPITRDVHFHLVYMSYDGRTVGLRLEVVLTMNIDWDAGIFVLICPACNHDIQRAIRHLGGQRGRLGCKRVSRPH